MCVQASNMEIPAPQIDQYIGHRPREFRLRIAPWPFFYRKSEIEMIVIYPIELSEYLMNQPTENTQDNAPANPPIFNLPNVILLFLLIMVTVQVARDMLLSDEQNVWLIINGAFITQRYLFSFADQNLAYFTSPITYSFIHGGYGHLAVNSLWLAAFGAVVARRFGVFRFTVFWVLSALASVAFFAALNWGQAIPVVGASGVVSAIMGAAARFAFPLGGRFNREKAHFLPRQSFSDVLQNRTVLVYLGFWFVISLLPAIGVGASGDASSIAWEAHIGGFLFGFLFFNLFDHKDW